LDSSPPGHETIRTIVSSKGGGCESNRPELYGIAVSVNAWESPDRKVHIELGDAQSGCHKIDSADVTITSEAWHYVSVALMVSGEVIIFVDGTLANRGNVVPHVVAQAGRSISVGRYPDGSFPFFGNISALTTVHVAASTDLASVQDISSFMYHTSEPQQMKLPHGSTLGSFYPLVLSESTPSPGSVLKEVVMGLSGKFFMLSSAKVSGGLSRPLQHLISGLDIPLPARHVADSPKARTDNIRGAMKVVWKNYEVRHLHPPSIAPHDMHHSNLLQFLTVSPNEQKYAWGRDELKPISKQGRDNWGGMGVTLVDSLDTLWLMGLRDEFTRARDWVRDHLNFNGVGTVSVFETTIRELGGLLAAYDFSKDAVFLDKAVDLGRRLIKAFETSSGIARERVSLRSSQTGPRSAGGAAVLSELGSLQLEFRFLAEATGDMKFESASMKAFQIMHRHMPKSGLFPIRVNIADGTPADTLVTLGALGDSFYEYLLKVWLQGGRKEDWLREMYDSAINGIVDKLLQFSSPTGLVYLADWTGRSHNHKMDHLVCFLPGVMALGAYTDPTGFESARAQRDLEIAKGLMYTCYQMYHRMESGISPEYVEFRQGRDIVVPSHVHFYILRPETAESLFVLHQLTGIAHYQEWAWEIWRSIDEHCRKGAGYGSLRNVNRPQEGVDDRMESFFLGETIKYLYLVQDSSNTVDLSRVVLNTEAHPFTILKGAHRPVQP